MATPTLGVNPWHDKELGAALLAAPVFWVCLAWLVQPVLDLRGPLAAPALFLSVAVLYPALEEVVFRGGLQTLLLGRPLGKVSWHRLTLANVVTSLVFATLHLLMHAPLWALAAFFPSLVFGYFRERHASLATPIGLHIFYNTGYFWLFGF